MALTTLSALHGVVFDADAAENIRTRAEKFSDPRYPVQGLLGVRTNHGCLAFKVARGAEPSSLGLDIVEFLLDMPGNGILSARYAATRIRWCTNDRRVTAPEPAANMLYALLDAERQIVLPDNRDFLGRLNCRFAYILDFHERMIEVTVWATPQRQRRYLRRFDNFSLEFVNSLSLSYHEVVTDGPVRRTGWTWLLTEPIPGPRGAAMVPSIHQNPHATPTAHIAQVSHRHSTGSRHFGLASGSSRHCALGSVAMTREASSTGIDRVPIATNASAVAGAPPPVVVSSRPWAFHQFPTHSGPTAVPMFNIPTSPTIFSRPATSGHLLATGQQVRQPHAMERLPSSIGSPRHGLGPYSPEINYGPIGGHLNHGYESDTDTVFDVPTGAGITVNDVWSDEALAAWPHNAEAGPSSGWVAPPPSQAAETRFSVPAAGLQQFAGHGGQFYFGQNADEYDLTNQIEPLQI